MKYEAYLQRQVKQNERTLEQEVIEIFELIGDFGEEVQSKTFCKLRFSPSVCTLQGA